MALYRRGRVWYVDYYAYGERVQESTSSTNRREAERYYALRRSEVERGLYAKPVKISLPELGERYLDYAKAHKLLETGCTDVGSSSKVLRKR